MAAAPLQNGDPKWAILVGVPAREANIANMPWIALLVSLATLSVFALPTVNGVTKVGSVTYQEKNPSRQDAGGDENSENLPQGYVHQVPSAFHPQQASAYPGDLSSFLSSSPVSPVPVRRRTRPRTVVAAVPIGTGRRRVDDPQRKPKDEELDPYQPKAEASFNLPGYAKPEGTNNRFTDTEAEFSFNGAGYTKPENIEQIKISPATPEKQDNKVGGSAQVPQRLLFRRPLVNRPRPPFGVPLLSSEEGLHLAQSAPEINYYPGLPSFPYPGLPEFMARQKREAADESMKSKKLHKTIKLYLHRMIINKTLGAKPKKTSHLDKMVKLDTKLIPAASEYHSETEGFQASFPYFRSSLRDPGFDFEESRARHGLRIRDRRPSRQHSLYATETRAYGMGYGNLGSGNFEVIRGGIFSDGHAESSQNPVHAASYGGGGGGGGYDYEDDEDEPILGFQGYNNFGSLHNALASRKRITNVPAVGRRSSEGHPEGHTESQSQLIPMNHDLLAMD